MMDIQKMGDEVVRSISKAASDNPLSAALIGAGILWMMTGAARPALAPLSRMASGVGSAAAVPLGAVKDAVVSGLEATGEVATNVTGVAKSTIDEGSTSIANSLTNVHQQATHLAGNMYESAEEITGSLKETLSQLFEKQPLALAAVGLAIGAGIASAMPASATEKAVMGNASADVTSTVSSVVSERAAAVKDAVLTEMDNQGLTPDKANEALQVGIEKVTSVMSPT